MSYSLFRCLLVVSCTALLNGCLSGDAPGMIVTRDGRMTAETAEVSRDELTYRLGQRASDAAGKGWNAKVAIQEMPKLHETKADEWGWSTMTITLDLFPPAGSAADPAVLARAESAIRDAAIYRVHRQSDIRFVSTMASAGAVAPGTLTYTTVAGDTFAGISTAFYGTPQHWRRIADANPQVDAAQMAPGTVLSIPPKP